MKNLLFLVFGLISVTLVSADNKIKFHDLYGRGGEFSALAQQLNGQRITVRGYMAPPIKSEVSFFVLTKMPMSVCPFCETEADWPIDILFVRTNKTIDVLPYNVPLYVTGELGIGTQTDTETGFVSRVRLINASYKKAQ